MPIPRAALALLLLLAAVAPLAGCGSTPPSRFFELTTLPPDTPAAAETVVALDMAPVSLPSLLDRSQMITRLSGHERRIDEYARWTTPLADALPSVLAENLAVLLPAARIAPPGVPGESQALLLVVSIARFDADTAGEVTLEARWVLRPRDPDALVLGRDHRAFREQAASGEPEDVAAAMSRALAALSRELAARIVIAAQSLPDSPRGTP